MIHPAVRCRLISGVALMMFEWGARSYYEGFKIDEHGHALIVSTVPSAMTNRCYLKKKLT